MRSRRAARARSWFSWARDVVLVEAPQQSAARDPEHLGRLGLVAAALLERAEDAIAFGPSASLPSEMEALERDRILGALQQCGGNQTQAAEMLGISRRTLLRRLDEYNVPRPRKP